LCNKICGASHYNMQMKVVVDTPEDYKKWLSEKATLVSEVKAANATPEPVEGEVKSDSTQSKDTAAVAKIAMK
jgi:cytochrome c oxidase subunit 2